MTVRADGDELHARTRVIVPAQPDRMAMMPSRVEPLPHGEWPPDSGNDGMTAGMAPS